MTEERSNRRILVIDDNERIHEDFRKVLSPTTHPENNLSALEESIFGESYKPAQQYQFEIDSAFQGRDGVDLVKEAIRRDTPYAIAFVDVRMPPGWDGVETTARLWDSDPDLQIVICTAYSDYSWNEMLSKLGITDQLVILKKPFDNIEVFQLATALTEKWRLTRSARYRLQTLEEAVSQRTRELQETNQQLARAIEHANAMAEEAQVASLAKSRFLANMSHELRTPMNGIIGMTGILLDTPLDVEQREFAEIVRASADSMLIIINDILDFSRIESGHMSLDIANFDLREVVDEALEMLNLLEERQVKKLELISDVSPGIPTRLRGDSGRLRQVLTNLVGNAIKFTNSGEVVVRVTVERDLKSHVSYRFEIKDSGIGISPEAQVRLFQAFSQADVSINRKYGGTGLGLAISKQLVSLMKGRIGLESAEGLGATFWFTVDFEKQPDCRREPEANPLEFISVLIVSERETLRRVMTEHLRRSHVLLAEETTFENATQALGRAAAGGRRFDVALLDMQMSGVELRGLVRYIKGNPSLAATRLIGLSSGSESVNAKQWVKWGLEEILAKPVKLSRLLEAVNSVHREPKGGFDASRPLERSVFSELRVLVAEDNPANQKVALGQLEKLGCIPDLASSGLQVLEALTEHSYDLILMDCQMPEMDGYTATSAIREAEATRLLQFPWMQPVHIIAMTAYAMKGDREKCLEAGMNDYISKPVRQHELEAALERWLNDPAALRAIPGSDADRELY
jgi:two-component system sensor histidine kinase/response regulator